MFLYFVTFPQMLNVTDLLLMRYDIVVLQLPRERVIDVGPIRIGLMLFTHATNICTVGYNVHWHSCLCRRYCPFGSYSTNYTRRMLSFCEKYATEFGVLFNDHFYSTKECQTY